MLRDMCSRVRNEATPSRSLGTQPSLTSFLGQSVPNSSKSVLMRKQLELARQGCKFLRLQAAQEGYSNGRYSSASGSRGSSLPSDLQLGQHRSISSAKQATLPEWRHTVMQARSSDEDSRSRRPNPSVQTFRRRNRTQDTAAHPGPINHAAEAISRANPTDPAHPSRLPDAVPLADPARKQGTFGGLAAGAFRHTARSPVVVHSTATQSSSTEFQEAAKDALNAYDLHSPTVNHLAALVRTSTLNTMLHASFFGHTDFDITVPTAIPNTDQCFFIYHGCQEGAVVLLCQ